MTWSSDKPLRIIHLCQSYPPMVSGAALVVQRLSEGLAARGHEVMVIAASDKTHPYRMLERKVQVCRLRSLSNPFRADQRFIAWSPRSIAAELTAFQANILHFHDPLAVGLSGLYACRHRDLRNIKVLTVHGLPSLGASIMPNVRILKQATEDFLWRYAYWFHTYFDAVLTPSKLIAQVLRQHGCDHPYPIVNGVNLSQFNPDPSFPGENKAMRKKYGLDPELPVILYIGRVDVDKQVHLLIRAATQAMSSVDAQLLIVGSGKGLAKAKLLTRELGIQERSHFTGFVPMTGDLPALYRLGSVFCNASIVETQSCVVLEAAATALPIVAFQATCMPEFVNDGKNGFLAPASDTNEMAKRIIFVLQNPQAAKSMGQASLALARSYSNDNFINQHEALYASLLTSQQGG